MDNLTEWVLANNIKPTSKTTKSSSLSYEEKFKKILEYHIDYVTKHPSHLEFSNHIIKSLFEFSDATGFHYQEHVSGNNDIEWDNDVVVIYDKRTGEWIVKEFKDGEQEYIKEGKGFNELLDELGSWHLVLPKETSPEYHELRESTFADDFKLYETLFD